MRHLRAIAIAALLILVAAAAAESVGKPVEVVKLAEWRLERLGRESEPFARLLQRAKRSVGVPYKWGGTRLEKGIDCSNFTWQLFQSIGKPYERFLSTRSLAVLKNRNGLKRIDYASAKPEDLLVYGYKKGKKWHGHVVILVDRDGALSGHKGLVLGAHGGEVDAVEFVTFKGFEEGYFKNPRMKLCNVLRVEGMRGGGTGE